MERRSGVWNNPTPGLFSRQCRPQIHISAKADGHNWIVCERILGLFKSLHSDEYEGTGLGLGICKRIVERYGAESGLKGVPAKGRLSISPSRESGSPWLDSYSLGLVVLAVYDNP